MAVKHLMLLRLESQWYEQIKEASPIAVRLAEEQLSGTSLGRSKVVCMVRFQYTRRVNFLEATITKTTWSPRGPVSSLLFVSVKSILMQKCRVPRCASLMQHQSYQHISGLLSPSFSAV
jgi:hypothetical protein